TISSDGYDEYVRKRLKHIDVERRRAKKEQEEFAEKMSRYRRVHDSVENALRATKNDSEGKNLKDKMHTVKSVGRRIEREKKNMSKNPEIEDAINIFFDDRLYIPNGRVILDFKLDELKAGNRLLSKNIELKITGPEKICIVGKNGSGKTTLIKRLINEFESLKFKVGYMPQNYSDLTNYDVNAIEYLSRSFSKDEHSTVSTYLAALNFKREEMYRKIQNLSGGQKAKLFFAKMNLDCAEVLVLDEPTRNLSPLSQPEILNALADYRGVIIAISHDRDFIGQIPEKVYELNEEGLFRIN
ncbi:MAG TPA: molybdopterin-guanine dinucleotide biosynthesis protein MobB, partial [Bacillota bacterium]|nr:molybdopterin-guanine dinucleotide biosynthesis protein MobB [Bacillota bacterium]